MATPERIDRGRRAAARLALAAPVSISMFAVGGLGTGCTVRGALVGARGFSDSVAAPGPFPKPLSSPSGERRTLVRPPRRIVSTYLGADELIAELADPARVAGVSVYADDRGTSNCLGQFPGGVARLRSDPEAVFALEPDLICVAGFTETDSLRLIESAGVPVVYWSRFDSFTDVLDQLALYGAALGEEARAGAIATAVRGRLADLDVRLRGARRVRTLYFDPPAFTMGRGTLVDEILVRAGAINVVDELGLAGPCQIDLETILALAPEVILLPSYAENGSALRALAAAPIWRQVPAARAQRVHEIPGAWIATVSHHAARGLERVARLLHPEAFAGEAHSAD